jgi:ribonuclease HI
MALIGAITWISDHKTDVESIVFHADSELLVRQQLGQYKVKAPTLVPLFRTTQELLGSLDVKYSFAHIRREFNSFADELANQAMDHPHHAP